MKTENYEAPHFLTFSTYSELSMWRVEQLRILI